MAPTITASGTPTFTGGGTAVTLDSALTVTDVDSGGNLTGATVRINTGCIAADQLNFTTQNGITGSYNSTTGTLTLSGTATLANYQTALESITYNFSPGNGDPTAGGTDLSRTIDWTVTDGSTSNGPSNTASTTLDTAHVAPTITASGTVTYAAGGFAAALDPTATVIDVDSGGVLTGATVAISAGFLTGDTLNFTNQDGITGSYNASSGVLTLTGTASVANYQAALDCITYSFTPAPPTGDPTDGGTDTEPEHQLDGDRRQRQQRHQHTRTSLTSHAAPTITAGGSPTFIGGGAAVALDPSADAHRCRQRRQSHRRDGDDQHRLHQRRHAELHHPERHHRQLQYGDRHADADRHGEHRQLPGGARLDHLQLHPANGDPTGWRQPTSSRTHQLDGDRRQHQQRHQQYHEHAR